jgi:NAD(P)-dependent dehydrogenase (short-subunit alcohol dehydrogenase family)/putative sterol carrier protein
MIKSLAGKTLFVSGGSRGIGKAIALRAAADGANVILAAKTAQPHPKLPGTIYTAAKEIEAAGGNCLPCMVDIRYEDQVQRAMDDGAKQFGGGIDILINNASAISLTGVLDTDMKKYDLMNQINARGTYLCSRVALPYLLKASNPHILNLAPPLSMLPKWFKSNTAYAIAKYGMSMCVLGMAAEFESAGVAVNALWPRTAISTDAIDLIGGAEMRNQSRSVDIMSDAAHHILSKESRTFTGNFCVDEYLLRHELGVDNFDKYSIVSGKRLMLDFFLDEASNAANEDDLVTFIGPNEVPAGALYDRHANYTKTSQPVVAEKSKASTPNNSNSSDISVSMNALKPLLSAELVAKTKGVYAFKITDASPADWYLDLKNGAGTLASGEFAEKVNCTMTMKADAFNKMIAGELKPTSAFMSGKLKIKGDMGLAMKLEKIMSSMKAKL